MRSPFFRPSAINALATRLVLTLNSANVVCRPSNSKAGALPRFCACARTTSARLFAAISVVDMFLPVMSFYRSVGGVPRMLRSAKRCAADPGSIRGVGPGSAVHRCRAAPRPGHESISPPCRAVLLVLLGDRVAGALPVGIRPFAHLVEIAAGG